MRSRSFCDARTSLRAQVLRWRLDACAQLAHRTGGATSARRLKSSRYMARRRRILFPGAVYHVMARGNRRTRIFEDDTDCERFFTLMSEAVERYEVRIYAACLMVNHFHVVGETPRGNLADAMRFINGVYAQWSNRRHRRTGHLFEARYRSIVVQREAYLKRVARYVVLNPVRAGLVATPGAWPWTTYRGTAGLEVPQDWLSLEWLDWAFRAHSRGEAILRYQEYVNLPAKNLKHADGLAIGGTAFREQVAAFAHASACDRSLPSVNLVRSRPPLDTLFAARSVGLSVDRRSIYEAHVHHGYRQGDIARQLGLSPSTISRIISARRQPTRVRMPG